MTAALQQVFKSNSKESKASGSDGDLSTQNISLFAKAVEETFADNSSGRSSPLLALASADILLQNSEWASVWADCLSKHCSAVKILESMTAHMGISSTSLRSRILCESGDAEGLIHCHCRRLLDVNFTIQYPSLPVC